MAKKKKNNNYVTEKRENAKREAERTKEKQRLKQRILAVVSTVAIVVALVVGVILLGTLFGWWEEQPAATHHAVIDIENYGSLHVELYSDDAPASVTAFLKLADEGAYNGIALDKFLNGMLEMGTVDSTDTIVGEFAANGFENIVKHKRGVLSMARPDGNDSANGEFFLVTKTAEELDGNYAAFGKITDGMDVIDRIVKDCSRDENGNIAVDQQPKITNVSIHAHH